MRTFPAAFWVAKEGLEARRGSWVTVECQRDESSREAAEGIYPGGAGVYDSQTSSALIKVRSSTGIGGLSCSWLLGDVPVGSRPGWQRTGLRNAVVGHGLVNASDIGGAVGGHLGRSRPAMAPPTNW